MARNAADLLRTWQARMFGAGFKAAAYKRPDIRGPALRDDDRRMVIDVFISPYLL